MAASPTQTVEQTPDPAPFLRQPPPSASELAQLIPTYGPLPPEEWPNVDHLITEDDTPVDNIYSEKQQRLLTECLYASWSGPGAGRPFIALANVGLFHNVNYQAVVPDVLVSLDVALPADIWVKRHRSYMIWQYGKPPEVVIEIVSNTAGGEASTKLRTYARMGVAYYVIYDPEQHLSQQVVQLYELHPTGYRLLQPWWMPGVELGLTLGRARLNSERTPGCAGVPRMDRFCVLVVSKRHTNANAPSMNASAPSTNASAPSNLRPDCVFWGSTRTRRCSIRSGAPWWRRWCTRREFFCYSAVVPPSITSSLPVTNDDSSDAR